MTFNLSLLSKFQLRDIVNNLCEKRAISAKENFLKDYDNGNSIWDKSEIDLIKQDYNAGILDSKYEYVEEQPEVEGDLSFETFKENVSKLSQKEQQNTKFLLNINNGTQRFDRDDILKLAKLPSEEFEKMKKFLYIKSRQDDQFSSTDLCSLAQITDDKLDLALKLSYTTSRKDEQFDGEEILMLTQLNSEQFKIAQKYFYIQEREEYNIQLSGEEICDISKLNKDNLKEFERVTKADKNYSILSSKEGTVEIIYDDCEGHRTLTSVPHKFEQNTLYKKLPGGDTGLIDDLTTVYDADNNVIRKTHIQKSELDDEEWNVTQEVNGAIRDLQKTYIDSKTGETVVVKEYTSPNGTKTATEVRKNGNNKHNIYTITSANGEILFQRKQSFEKVSDTKTITNINGKIYEAEFTDNSVTVVDKTNEKTYTIDFKKILGDDLSTPFAKQCIEILKNIPAKDIIYMTKDKFKIEKEYAHCEPNGTVNIYLSEEKGNTFNNVLSIFMHEFGHFKDLSEKPDFEVISGNEELIATFNRELEAYKSDTAAIQQQAAKHMTDDGITELVAETNMLVNGFSTEETNHRDFLIQQYFPETIAIIAKLLDEDFETRFC